MPNIQTITVTIPDEGISETFETWAAFPTESGGWIPTHSMLLVCPLCGKSWAALIRQDDPRLWPEAAICASCPPEEAPFRISFPPPGSILISWSYNDLLDTALLAALPPSLLRREFFLHERRLTK